MPSDATQNTDRLQLQNDRLYVGNGQSIEVASGANLTVKSGGTLTVESGGTMTAASGATASINNASSPFSITASAGASEYNHLAVDQPKVRFYSFDYGTGVSYFQQNTSPWGYFAADGGFATGAHVTICNVSSGAVNSSYTGERLIYYRPMAWNQELANYFNHPASSTAGYTPVGTYMLGVQNDVNGPSIFSVQYGSNSGPSNPQGAMLLCGVDDSVNKYCKIAIHHDFTTGAASSDNTWLMFGSVNVETTCLDNARGPGISATNYKNAFDIHMGRNGTRQLALKGNGTNGAALHLREYDSATPTTDVAAPSDGQAVLYVKDNGAGKEQLCVRFATGAVQVLATEP